MPELAELAKALTKEEQATLVRLCMPSMRGVPRLLRLRYAAQAIGLRHREVEGVNARRLAFVKDEYQRGRFHEW